MARRTLIDHVPATLHLVPLGTIPLLVPPQRSSATSVPSCTTVRRDWSRGSSCSGSVTTDTPPHSSRDPQPSTKYSDFVAVDVPGRGWRLTATAALLARFQSTVFLVSGSGKAEILAEVLTDTCDLPAARVARAARTPLWLVDRDAARLL